MLVTLEVKGLYSKLHDRQADNGMLAIESNIFPTSTLERTMNSILEYFPVYFLVYLARKR